VRPEPEPPVPTPTEIPPTEIVGGAGTGTAGTGTAGSGTLMVDPPLGEAPGALVVGGAGDPDGVGTGRLGSPAADPSVPGRGSEGTEGAVDGAVPRFAAPMPSTTGPSALAIGLVAEPTPPACSGSEGLPGTRAVTPLADGPLRCRSAARGAVRSSVRPYSCGLRPLGAGFRRPAPSSPQHRFPLHLLVPPDPPKISVFSCWFRCR